jgi:catechol 2,3-dioxygenase-like lactoylglutathione lyase family enzyme
MPKPAEHLASLKTKITTPLYAETRAFYEEVMGFQIAEVWDEAEDAGVIYRIGADAYLEIYRGEAGDGFDRLSLQFKTPDLDAFIAALDGRWPWRGPTPRPWGSTYLYLEDPNGVPILVFSGEGL